MTTSGRRAAALMNLAQAERRAELVQADIEAALSRLTATENEPSEPKRNSIVKFQVQFAPNGDVYTYVAYRAPTGYWYRTGDKETYDWERLLDFMYRDQTAKRLGVGFYVYTGKVGKWVGRAPQ